MFLGYSCDWLVSSAGRCWNYNIWTQKPASPFASIQNCLYTTSKITNNCVNYSLSKNKITKNTALWRQKHTQNYKIISYSYTDKISILGIYMHKKVQYNSKASNNRFLFEYMLQCNDTKLYFQHHSSSLQCHMIFRNHSDTLIYCSCLITINVENSCAA